MTLEREVAMKEFIRRHEAHIHGVLSCFDRMLFRGYLPIMSGWSMAQFIKGLGVGNASLKPCANCIPNYAVTAPCALAPRM